MPAKIYIITQREIADEFKVSQAFVNQLLLGKNRTNNRILANEIASLTGRSLNTILSQKILVHDMLKGILYD